MFCFSRPKRASTTITAVDAGAVKSVPELQRVGDDFAEQPLVPEQLHLVAATRGAVPHEPVRPVHTEQQYHGHRQHMRAGRPAALLRRGVGPEHSVLPGPAGHRPGRATAARVVRTLRAQRVAVFYAPPRCPPSCRRRSSCLPHVC